MKTKESHAKYNKRNILIFDGIDGVGKSTISNALSEIINRPVFKKTNVKNNYDFVIDLVYSVESYTQFLEQTKYSVIFDRLYPSEYAYSKVFNRYTIHEKIKEIDRRFAKMGAKIIILEKNKKSYVKDDIIPIEKYDELKTMFRKFAKITKCPSIIIDTSDQNLKKQIKQIIDFI